MNVNDELRHRVRDARVAKGWTQEELAQRADVSERTYQNFEAGTTSPQGATLRGILRAVGIDPANEDIAEATREGWRASTRVILDTLGAYLETLDEDQAVDIGGALVRQIFEGRLTGRPIQP